MGKLPNRPFKLEGMRANIYITFIRDNFKIHSASFDNDVKRIILQV